MAPREPLKPEKWEELRGRLEGELRYNPLDVENPPNPMTKPLDKPYNMAWPVKDPSDEANPDGKNSISLLNAIKLWEMELPDMYAACHSLLPACCSHPLPWC